MEHTQQAFDDHLDTITREALEKADGDFESPEIHKVADHYAQGASEWVTDYKGQLGILMFSATSLSDMDYDPFEELSDEDDVTFEEAVQLAAATTLAQAVYVRAEELAEQNEDDED